MTTWITDPEREEDFLAPLDISNVWHRMGVVRLEAKDFEEAEDLFEKSLSIRERILGSDDILCKKSRVWLRRCRREQAAAAAVSDTLISRYLYCCAACCMQPPSLSLAASLSPLVANVLQRS